MSFNSNYLKLRAEREGSSANNAGGSTPPATSQGQPSGSGANSYTSSYLALREKRNNMTISERAEAKAQALLKKQQEQASSPAGILRNYGRNHSGPTTSGGYYSRPELGSYSERLHGNITALEPVLTEKRAALDTAQTSLVQAETDLNTVQGYLQQARAAYDADPTNENATSYNQIVGAYNLAYDAYASAFKTYSTAYDAYKPYEDQLIDALAIYQLYSNQQQAAFDDWRGTIRDAATIQTEIAAIDQQMADLEVTEAAAAEAARQQQLAEHQARQDARPWYEKLAGYLGGVQDTTLPLAGVTPGTVEAAFNQPEKTTSREMQQLIDMKKLLQEELNWSQYYYYADFAGASDFAEMSKYVPQEEKEQRALDIMLDNYSSDASPWEDPLYEYINGNDKAGAWLSNAAANYYGPDNAIGAFFGRATENKAESQQMTEQEVATFNYLYATQGKAAAHAYYDYLLADLNYRQRKADEEYWAEYAAKDPVGSSVFSVAMSPVKGLSYVGQLSDYLGDGEIDQNAAYNKFSYIPSAIRETVPKNWGAVGTFAYQTGMSMADFLMTTAITGGNQTAALTIMGSGAAADTTLAAKDRGLEDWQAFTLGTVAGLAEVLTEKVSLDTLLDADLLKDNTLKYIFKNALAEGSEEVASSTVNLLADIFTSKDRSEWMKSIEAYMADGMTKDEAFAKAMADQALSLGVDFLGGFISGGAMGGGGAVIGNINTQKMGNELGGLDLNENDIQAFIETGLESDPGTASYQLAVEMQAKIEAGEALSNYDLARLYQANVQTQPEAGWDSSTDPKNVSLPRLDDESGGEVSAEAMRRQAQTDYRAGKITEAEFDAIIDEVMHLEELEDGTSVKTFDNQADTNAQTDNININVNGGTTYDNIQQQPGRPAAAQSTGGFDTQRADIPDGVPIRDAGQGAGIQTGQMASSAGRQGTQTNSQAKAIVERQNTAGDLRQQGLISATSSLALGIESGTDTENLYVMPQEYYDAELLQAAQFARAETGLNVAFTVGNIEINRGSRTGKVRGVHTGQQIVVQSDNAKATAMQLVKHEVFHDKVMKDPGLTQRLKEEVRDRFTPQEFDAVMDRYIDELWPLYGPNDETAWDEYEGAWNIILEEMLADAYAGINAFGAHAEQFTETVNELIPSNAVDKQQKQDNGTEEPTGPPYDRYSFAGENANNADLDALARAKEMQAAGVADETIRQQTGWHTGMDGKWRWEIDDSGMEYSSRGDLGLRERRPEYARYRELLDKANRHALELSDEALTPAETAELQKLKDIWGGTFRKAGRITEDALPTELLSDYVKHDALFEAYPQLRKTRLRFADLPEGTRGQYDPEQDIITLSNKLRGKPQDTLVHEIQHVIQKAEGFAQGSSPEFWEQVQKGEQPVRANDRRVAEAERKIQEIMDSLPPFVAGQFELHRHLEKTDPDKAMELADALSEGPYGDEFSDFFLLTWDLDMAAGEDNYIRGAGDLYRNTAGEIEARDAASRRQLTADQRRNTAPARADDRTVFVEDVDETVLAEMDAEYGPQLQPFFDPDLSAEEIDGNIQQVAQMDPVTQISGEEFAKGEKDLITQVEEFFAGLGNVVFNAELGDVVLDRRGIKSDVAHGIGRKKAAAFAAVPDVVAQGLIVDYQQNWKDRGYDTAVVAAPITIGAEDHIAAVILTRSNQTNRFYVHEVLTTKNGAMPFKTGTREGYPGGDAPSVFSILDKIRSVKNETGSQERFSVDDSDDLSLQLGERFSVDDVDSHGHSLTPEQQEFYAQSQARDSSGRLLVLYHQTDGDFTIFDTRHPGAGSRDSDTPFGIFLKQTAGDIGLAGKKQMALYANITNPLRAANREDLARQLREISGSYASISDKHKQLDAQYHEKFEQAKKAWRDYIIEWRAANPGANRSALNDDPKFNELFDAEDAVVDEWTAAADLLSTQAKEAITDDLRKAGYDGVFLESDVGSWGRRTDAIIALDPQQVKKISNKTPTSNPDIRYSVDDADDQVAIGDLQAELYQLQHRRRSLLEADTAYAAAADKLRYANTFTEKVAARKAMAAAEASIDTAAIDQRISDLNERISEIRNRETRQHREDQEKYSGTKTAGYSTMPDTRLKDLDQDYMKAVRSGDRARMAELVEQAAEAAMPASVVRDKSGRLLKTYHHTGSRFTVFDRNMARTGTEMDGFFFAPDPDSTSEYGSNMITAYLNITKLAMDPKLDRKFNDSGTLLREKLAYQGYDGMARTENGEIYEYMTFDPEQIKSADPVVYDDRGRVVPLSERFNFHNPDIRYSVDETDASGVNELRENMTTKEREILRGVETRLLRNIGGALSVTKFGDRSYLKSVIRGLSDTYLESGTIDQQAMDDLFEQAYRQGIVVDRELHDQYEEVRKYLHTVSLTLDPRDRSDIADYPDFVKRMRGRMRIVNEGGLPVDSAWHELNDMAPELFPDSIAHPADQLVRMTEVLESLRITEKSLSDYYGPMASTYKKDAKAEFERAVWESIGELRQIRRFEQERQQKLQDAEPAPTTPEEAMEAWTKLKTARKTYEKAMAKNLLTTEDEIAVGELLKGKMLPEHLDKNNLNVKGILAVYEAKQEYEHLTKLLAEYRRKVKADIRAEADSYLETANTWKDKNVGLAYSREIMQRNVEDIVPDKKLAKAINERYFETVRDAEAAAVKMKEGYREAVRKLNLSRNVKKGNLVSEAHAVQLYGEAMDNIRMLEKARGRLKHRDGKSLEEWRGVVYKLWQENPGLDKAKIENAVAEMRRIYDELFQKMNEVRVRWGYEPVNYRQGYFPHFQPGDGDGIMAQFGRVLGIDTQVVALPTTINGLTHTFKPGIQWFGNAQERLGFNTAYDAVEGFDRYIEGLASVICQTENIQRLRALASQIRYRTSDEGIRKQVDAIYSNAALTEEQKNDAISGIYEKGRYTLSNFVVEVDEYTNLLANKKSKLDRTVEALIGRKFYTAMKWLESRVGANMIAGNVTSALTNFIPLTQASAQLSKKAMLKGMWDTLASYKTDDGIIDRSAFLTNRRGSDPLVKVWSAKVSEVLGKPMELIDSFTSGSIVRAAYYQNLKQGLSESEAMHQADIFASRVMAERSKGGMPTLFESKNPFFKLFTQFQLEVNNQWSEVFKDIPRSQREKGLGALALVFLQYFLGAWLFNNLYEKWIGRRPAMDPIDIVLDTVKDFTSDDVSTTDALGNLANNVLEELPFSSALTLIGIETDGGRVPVSSGIPNIPALISAATNEDWAPEKRWKEAQDELNKLAYVIPPFGGNQVSKIWKGIKAYIEGGSYSVDSDGNDILQYPVYNDESGDFWGLVQAMLLGKSALPEAKEWVEDGFDSLTAKQTAIYQDMIYAGVSEREAYDLIDSLRSAAETDETSKKEAQIGILLDADATDECKAIAFYGLLATDNERMLMDSLTDAGALPGAVMDTLIQLRDTAALPSAEEKVAQADILIDSALTESEKEIVIRSWLDDEEVNENGKLTSLGKFNLAMKQGITTDEYLQFRATGMDIEKLLEYTAAGFEADEAQDLAQALDELEPLPDKSTVSNLQKWRASVDFSDDVEDQLTALSMIMEPKSLAVWETANDYGVAPNVYVTFQEIATQYDTDGNGSYTQGEVKAAIDAEFPHLTTAQKAVLWQWVCYSSGSKKNPYDPTVGQNFIDSRDAAKAAAEE